jgi:protein-tyrosine phosphatase
MDFGAEIINISKIKDSFFIGDKVAGTNLDVLLQFKISHIINAAGNQIFNYFESVGIQYYTLYWSENPSQVLFDKNDEIVDKILLFIKESLSNGEGLLIHSVKGQDRCCVVVIIYLMRKYNWSVSKSIDFLKSKKEDIEIEPYFLEQLLSYEMRLSKITNIKSNWIELTSEDNDENLLRNTYVNGIPVKQLNSVGMNEINNNNKIASMNKDNEAENLGKKNKLHINWAENDKLVNFNYEKELLFQEEIQDITSHIMIKPTKSSIKAKSRNESSLSQALSLNSKKENLYGNNIPGNLNKKKLKIRADVNLDKISSEYSNISPNILKQIIENDIPGNLNKKKLKIRADVNLDKISSEYSNISPNILKQIIENDSFYFVNTSKNNTNNNQKLINKKNRPLSYDNKSKTMLKNNKDKGPNKLMESEKINNDQIGSKSYSLSKNGNLCKKSINNNNDMNYNNYYFTNEQYRIKKLIENNKGNKLLISLNNQNKMNDLINNFTYFNNNNYINGSSQLKKLYTNSSNKNYCNFNANNLSNSLKRSNLELQNNKKKSKYISFY